MSRDRYFNDEMYILVLIILDDYIGCPTTPHPLIVYHFLFFFYMEHKDVDRIWLICERYPQVHRALLCPADLLLFCQFPCIFANLAQIIFLRYVTLCGPS